MTEIAFHPSADARDLIELGRVLGPALRLGVPGSLQDVELRHIAMREVQVILERAGESHARGSRERVLDAYGSGVVVMRDFYEQVASGSTRVPRRVRRVAQRFARLALEGDPTYPAILGFAGPHRDVGARAVQAAVLTTAAGRRLGLWGIALARLALAALTADVGRVRMTGRTEGKPSEHAARRLLGSSSLASIAAGGADPSARFNAVVAFELAWAEHTDLFGEVYGARQRRLLSAGLVGIVRELLETLAPSDGKPGRSGPDALLGMLSSGVYPDELVRCLAETVGVLPAGTVVELAQGHWAMVFPGVGPSGESVARLIQLTDTTGRSVEAPQPKDVSWAALCAEARVVPHAQDVANAVRAMFGEAGGRARDHRP